MRSYKNHKKSSDNRPLLYDARGARIKASPLSNRWLRILLFYILPYVVINGIIFILVCYRPSVSIDAADTSDYVSSEVNFTVHSILPLKEISVSLESEPLEYVKSGNTYTCKVTQNGTFMVSVTSINGMQRREFFDIGVLDGTAPTMDAESVSIVGGVLTFTLNDNQSGVDYDSVYAYTQSDEELLPGEVDKSLGTVTMDIPSGTESVELYFSDMVGNEGSAHINLVSGG